MPLGPNWYWGCCCVGISSSSGGGDCGCCELASLMPPSVEVIIAGITNDKCLNCANFNGTYVLNVRGGCCYELTLPGNICPTGADPPKLEVCFQIPNRIPPDLSQCGVFARLILHLSGVCEESFSWANVTNNGLINGCCIFSGISLAAHEAFNCIGPVFPPCSFTGSTVVVSSICP
mgnify:CR=1 FL=1